MVLGNALERWGRPPDRSGHQVDASLQLTGIVFPSNRDALMIVRSVVLHCIKSEIRVDHAFLPMGTTDAEILTSLRRISALHFRFSDLMCIQKIFPEPLTRATGISIKALHQWDWSPPDRCCSQTLSEAGYRIRNLGRVSAAQQVPLRAIGRVRRISKRFDLICQPHWEAHHPGCPTINAYIA